MKPVTARAKDLGNESMMDAKAEARHKAAEALHREMYGDTDGLYGNATYYAANAAIDAYEAALAKTHVLVPMEATGHMTDAAEDAADDYFSIDGDRGPWLRQDGYKAIWAAMIAASEPK